MLRIILQVAPTEDVEDKKKRIKEIKKVVEMHFPSGEDKTSARVADGYILLTELVENPKEDQWRTFALAVSGIVILV